MKAGVVAASPEACVSALPGWQPPLVAGVRSAVRSTGLSDERIKWGHLVYFDTGPVLLIRVEAARVLRGFWRGQRLRSLEDRLEPGGKYEMATITPYEGDAMPVRQLQQLAKAAIARNPEFGDPTAIGTHGKRAPRR